MVGDPWLQDTDLLHELFRWWLVGLTAEQASERRLAALRTISEEQLSQLGVIGAETPSSQPPSSPTSSVGPEEAAALHGLGPEEALAVAQELVAAANSWGFRDVVGHPETGGKGHLFELLCRDTLDHWRFFNVLEHYLQQPTLLLGTALSGSAGAGGGGGAGPDRGGARVGSGSAASGGVP